jgi:hypothetical protein
MVKEFRRAAAGAQARSANRTVAPRGCGLTPAGFTGEVA